MTFWWVLLLQTELAAPPGIDPAKPFRVVRTDGTEVPAQAAGASIVLPTSTGEFRVEQVPPKEISPVPFQDDGRRLHLGKALRYNHGTVEAPEGVDKIFSRSGYLHPILTPDGRTISNDFPSNHLHHHGIWFPWTSSEFEGRKSDFWNSKAKQGRVEFVKLLGASSGPVFAGFRAEQRFVNTNGPDGPRPALNETWEVRVYAGEKRHVFDLTSTQSCATDLALHIRKYYYGGLGFRGSGEWEGKQGFRFLTSEGKSRVDGNETTARWALMTGALGGRPASIGFLCHPSNFRFPQPIRIHPSEPFFNWAPSQGGDFTIEPGKPYVSRYRFVVADEALGVDEMNALWKAYAEPTATLK